MTIGLLTAGVNAADESGSLGSNVAETVNWLFNLKKGSVSVLTYGATGNGTTDDTDAINAALTAGAGNIVVFPAAPVSYRVTTLNIPANTILIGLARVDVYNPSAVTDFNGGSTIRAINTSGVLNPQGVGIAIVGLSFVGGFSNTANLFTDASSPSRIEMLDCGFYFFKYGIGHNAKMINVSKIDKCHVAQNGIGILNLVDSHVTNCEVNANTSHGISQKTGANDTAYTGNKVEWNGGSNWQFFESTSCTINGGVCDRSTDNGFDIRNSSLTINGVTVRRNGAAGGKAHFYLETNIGVIIDGIITATGGDDGGGGTVSPEYIVIGGGAATGYSAFSNSDLSGFVTTPESGATTRVFFSGCKGVSDRKEPDFSYSGTIATASAQTITVSGNSALTPALSTFTVNSRKLRVGISTRNASTGAVASQEFIVAVNRGGAGGAVASIIGKQNSASTAINETGASLNVTISNVSADGTSLDVVATNTIASGLQAIIWINKYDQP